MAPKNATLVGDTERHTGGMRILAVSDVIDDAAYAPGARERFRGVGLLIGCGDLPYDYLDYIATELAVPLYAVHGNHDAPVEAGGEMDATGRQPATRHWWAGVDLHARVVRAGGLLLAGVGGSPRYSDGPYQLTEAQVWAAIAIMLPSLVWNRLRHGRFLDVLVTHAPPRGIHDGPDLPHRGFVALRLFDRLFRPRYHLHGHSHVYDRRVVTLTRVGDTTVINAYGAREVDIQPTAHRHPAACDART